MDTVPVEKLNIKLFADGADKESILNLYKNPRIDGFTTNPTLMKKAGITNYEEFARDILGFIKDRPFSLEVFSDELPEMIRQAKLISSWGPNVYVKIPITNTKGESTASVIQELSNCGIKLNITAITTVEQVVEARDALTTCPSAFVSVFAGRIADTGVNPEMTMLMSSAALCMYPQMELLWASTRELLNIYTAAYCGCSIITVTPDILKKLDNIGKDLTEYSLETVKMFYEDGKAAGYSI